MTPENQFLLDSIRTIVTETVTQAIAPLVDRVDALTDRVDALTDRVDALTDRVERIEAEQRDQRSQLDSLSLRMDSAVAYMMRLDAKVDTIEARTSEMATDIFDMQERLRRVEDRVRDGFHGLKEDISAAFGDIRAIRKTQNRHDKTLAALRDERAAIQQRISALEGLQG
jgi:chromosome segregation ATPase